MCGIARVFDGSCAAGVCHSAFAQIRACLPRYGANFNALYREPAERLAHRESSVIDAASGHDSAGSDDGAVGVVPNFVFAKALWALPDFDAFPRNCDVVGAEAAGLVRAAA